MILVRPIYTEHMQVDIEYQTITKLSGNSRKPTVVDKWLVTDTSSDKAYVVAKIEHLTKPFERADVSEDQTESYICGCDGFHYHYGDQNIEPTGECKHVSDVRKQNREIKADGRGDSMSDYYTVYVECDRCGEKELPAEKHNNKKPPQTRGSRCENCGCRY